MTEEFGYAAVFEDRTVRLDLDLLATLRRLLNRHVFKNRLDLISIEIDKSGNCCKSGSVMMYNYAVYDDPDEPGQYFLLTRVGVDGNGNKFYPPSISVNPVFFNMDLSLMTVAGILAHEMIHQETVENGNVLAEKFKCDMSGKTYDEHGAKFSRRMDEINREFGLNV